MSGSTQEDMHRPPVAVRSALFKPTSRRLKLACVLSLLGLLMLALWCGPVAAGSALSPAAGSAGPSASLPAHTPEAGPQRRPLELKRGSELFGKRRILRNADWAPTPPGVAVVTVDAPSIVLLAFAPRLPVACPLAPPHRADDRLPSRDHRRLLTERYPPQAPPLA
jgi:hypothetical protein